MSPVNKTSPQPAVHPGIECGTHVNPGRHKICLFLGAFVLLGALLLVRFHYQITIVQGASMQPTFHTGDLLLVDRQAYQKNTPRRGEIVIARYQGDLLVKRIVGLPGEKVEVADGVLYVNDKAMVEKHPIRAGQLSVGEGTLAPRKYALLGDNRHGAASVLVHGVVAEEQIVGRVVGSVPFGTGLLGLFPRSTT